MLRMFLQFHPGLQTNRTAGEPFRPLLESAIDVDCLHVFCASVATPSSAVHQEYCQRQFIPKILGGGSLPLSAVIVLISRFISESIFSVLRNRKIRTSYMLNPAFEIYHSRVANSVAVRPCRRPVETRLEGPRRGGVLARGQRASSGQRAPSPSGRWSGGAMYKAPHRGPGRIFGFWSILGLRNHVRTVS